ncbi:hypothetical protein SDC9_193045 [bioreactor metagenome]|uniref:Uncharacterized protein n=1 Tax=bioreactor metagenome TaxID=1076179 RepID=A0A645I2K8_9ZZZZ
MVFAACGFVALGRVVFQVVMKALQDVQAIDVHHLGLEGHLEVLEEVFGGNQVFHCFVQGQFVHDGLRGQGVVVQVDSSVARATSSSTLLPRRSASSILTRGSSSAMAPPTSPVRRRI